MAVAFIVTLLTSNILATKLTILGPFILPAAVVVYPFCFMCGDILTKSGGLSTQRKLFWPVLQLIFSSHFLFTSVRSACCADLAASRGLHYDFAPVPRIIAG